VTMGILSTIARERGRAVLVVTHDPRLFEFADRIVRIVDGTLTREELDETNLARRSGTGRNENWLQPIGARPSSGDQRFRSDQ